MVSNELHTFSLAFARQQTSLMIIHAMPIWATSKDCPVGTFKRAALFLFALSSWLTVALRWPGPPHLSPSRARTLTPKAPTRASTCTTSILPDFGSRSEQNKTWLFLARLFVWFPSFFLSIVLARHTSLLFVPLHSYCNRLPCPSSIFSPPYPWESSGPSWRRRSKEAEERTGREWRDPQPSHPRPTRTPFVTANRCVWVSFLALSQMAWKVNPNRASALTPWGHGEKQQT